MDQDPPEERRRERGEGGRGRGGRGGRERVGNNCGTQLFATLH